MAEQLALGLKAAFDAGLIHRDMKPGNILFSQDGTAKVVDFGLALVIDQEDESKEIWATPYYVPPEKLHKKPEDFRSDIYSLGASLFHALAGQPPYSADTASLEELKADQGQAGEHGVVCAPCIVRDLRADRPDDGAQTERSLQRLQGTDRAHPLRAAGEPRGGRPEDCWHGARSWQLGARRPAMQSSRPLQ